VVAATLPAGLEPDPSADGHANALFYDWQFSGSNEEFLNPERYQYREFFILLDALFEGKPVPIVHTFLWTTMRPWYADGLGDHPKPAIGAMS
jgi:hypothetical protein